MAWCVSNITVLLLIARHAKTVIVFLVYKLTRHLLSEVVVGAVCMAYGKLWRYLSDFF